MNLYVPRIKKLYYLLLNMYLKYVKYVRKIKNYTILHEYFKST